MTATSPARIAANRANSLKSTGPKTPEGKGRSRRNGLKHGLTGAGVVVAEVDRTEVDRRSEALHRELAPGSTLGAILVGQMAMLSVRMEHSARQEAAATATRVRHSGEVFDQARKDRIDLLVVGLADDPRAVVGELRRSAEGVDRLFAAWAELRGILTRANPPRWYGEHQIRATHLAGLRVGDPDPAGFGVLSRAIRGNFDDLSPEEREGLDPQARRESAQGQLLARIDGELAALEAQRATIDPEAVALDRRDAAEVALFDPSREAALARRYESEARRGFFKALKEFRQVEAEIEPESEPEVEPESVEEADPLASSRETPSPTRREPGPNLGAGRDRTFGGVEPAARGLDGRVLASGRAVVTLR